MLALVGDRTLLDDTVARFAGSGFAAPWVIAGTAHEAPMAAALPGVRRVIEPAARGTAAAVAVAAALAIEDGGDEALVLVTPADHAVAVPAALRAAIRSGAAAASGGWIATFGIAPSYPATGYGWIRAGTPLVGGARRVASFVEKPDEATAARLLAAGDHVWNSGLFLFAAGALARELDRLAPELWAAVTDAVAGAARDPHRILLDGRAFARAPAGSFDRVVMERTDRAAVVPVACGWSDVGTWQAVRELRGGASAGPVTVTASPGAFAWSDGPRVEVRGCPGITVVASEGGVLVAAPEVRRARFAAVCAAGPAWIPGAAADTQPGWAEHAAFARALAERWPVEVGALPGGGLLWLVDASVGAPAIGAALADDPWARGGVLGPAQVAPLAGP